MEIIHFSNNPDLQEVQSQSARISNELFRIPRVITCTNLNGLYEAIERIDYDNSLGIVIILNVNSTTDANDAERRGQFLASIDGQTEVLVTPNGLLNGIAGDGPGRLYFPGLFERLTTTFTDVIILAAQSYSIPFAQDFKSLLREQIRYWNTNVVVAGISSESSGVQTFDAQIRNVIGTLTFMRDLEQMFNKF